MLDLNGKVALVTGAGSGMGAAEATLFARLGAVVVVADIAAEDGMKATEAIIADGGRATFASLDVTNPADWKAAVTYTLSEFGQIDILVNNAGISGAVVTNDLEGWQRMMTVNAASAYLGTEAVAPAMTTRHAGSIVNISSIMAMIASDTAHPAYVASKGAVRSYTKSAAVQLGPHGIRVNSVHPGFMPPMKGVKNRAGSQDRAVLTPLRRTGEVLEVAHAVAFLASDLASFITGAELVVDGGYSVQ